MAKQPRSFDQIRSFLAHALLRPQMLAFMPALILGGYWFGSGGLLMVASVVVPVLLILGVTATPEEPVQIDALTGLPGRDQALAALLPKLTEFRQAGKSCIAFSIQIDDHAQLSDRLGGSACDEILMQTAARLTTAARHGDIVARLGEYRFGLIVGTIGAGGMEIGLQVAERVQKALAEPISIDSTSVYVTASIGFCLARRAPEHTAEAMLGAAESAMEEARRAGGGTIRAYSEEMREVIETRIVLAEELSAAFDASQIRPWFQPQVSTDTGEVTGFEALARWDHPERGIIPPADFLEALDNSGLMGRLGETMLFQSLSALRSWDRAGYHIPAVGVNFSSTELRDPQLVDRIQWELDRFDMSPDRLTVEVLETVVADAVNDVITANIATLATLGCTIDMDDFGTGHASIGNIRRFAVNRLKIDRSFVTHVDSDPQQQKMVSAILSMADQLDLDTLAEGVETVSEHSMLSQLGCGHVQGFGIARPMPFDETIPWLEKHNAKLGNTPSVGKG